MTRNYVSCYVRKRQGISSSVLLRTDANRITKKQVHLGRTRVPVGGDGSRLYVHAVLKSISEVTRVTETTDALYTKDAGSLGDTTGGASWGRKVLKLSDGPGTSDKA